MTVSMKTAIAAAVLATGTAPTAGQVAVEAPGQEGSLIGTFVAPAEGKPVVLVIPGSGPTDRDGNNPMGVTAAPYKLLAEDLAERLGAVDQPAFDLRIEGTGIFERKGTAHTLWAGIAPSPELVRHQQRIERICVTAGLEPEHRKYHPHITLARLNQSSGPLAPFCARTAGLALGPWSVDSYILYESTLHPEGSLYEPVVRYPLEPA